MSEQRRGDLHEGDSAKVGGGNEPGEVTDDTAAEGDDERLALKPMLGEGVIAAPSGSKPDAS